MVRPPEDVQLTEELLRWIRANSRGVCLGLEGVGSGRGGVSLGDRVCLSARGGLLS